MSHKLHRKLANQLDRVRTQKKGLRSFLLSEGYSNKNAEKVLKAYQKTY